MSEHILFTLIATIWMVIVFGVGFSVAAVLAELLPNWVLLFDAVVLVVSGLIIWWAGKDIS